MQKVTLANYLEELTAAAQTSSATEKGLREDVEQLVAAEVTNVYIPAGPLMQSHVVMVCWDVQYVVKGDVSVLFFLIIICCLPVLVC